ncbi:MAG: RDD family protein, partial [Actinomycetota bacterium]|nr:RDD family protein [Actinomycetota bacterium]
SAYATVGARIGALLIDGLLTVLTAVPAVVILFVGPTEIDDCRVDASGDYDPDGAFRGLCEEPTGGAIAAAVVVGAILVLGFALYQAHRQGTRGHTIGKSAVGIQVIDAHTGAYIGFGRSIGRTLFRQFISGNVLLLGYLWALWDSRNQTWHDKVVNSVVVKA